MVLIDPSARIDRRRRGAPLRWAALGAIALLVAGCSAFGDDAQGLTEPEPEPATATPGADWPTATAEEADLDPAVLAAVTEHARLQGSDCFLVARDGKVVVDELWRGNGPDDAHDVFSVTKSIASTLIGILVTDGLLALDDRVSGVVPEWRDPEHRDITVGQLLSMTAGLERGEDDYLRLARSEDRTATALALPVVAEPGTQWAYNNGTVQVLDAVIRAVAGQDSATFAEERLFGPLGMDRTDLHIDEAGNATLAFGATTTCRDLARLGQLVLDRGRWGDEQIVGADWIDAATSPSNDLNEAYGLLWWLNREGRRLSSALAISTDADEEVAYGQQVPGAPESLIWALGLGDQILQIDPVTRTLVVRVGRGQALEEPNRFDERATASVVTRGVRG